MTEAEIRFVMESRLGAVGGSKEEIDLIKPMIDEAVEKVVGGGDLCYYCCGCLVNWFLAEF